MSVPPTNISCRVGDIFASRPGEEWCVRLDKGLAIAHPLSNWLESAAHKVGDITGPGDHYEVSKVDPGTVFAVRNPDRTYKVTDRALCVKLFGEKATDELESYSPALTLEELKNLNGLSV